MCHIRAHIDGDIGGKYVHKAKIPSLTWHVPFQNFPDVPPKCDRLSQTSYIAAPKCLVDTHKKLDNKRGLTYTLSSAKGLRPVL